tara:strand:- start:438 stop:1043 length:606 start_codon:yes stop_codon:yes gene_type:complete
MKLRKKRGKVKGFEVKKGRVKFKPDYMIEKDKQDKFERAYEVDSGALFREGKIKVIKKRGEEYNPSKEEDLERLKKNIVKPSANQQRTKELIRKRRKAEQDNKKANNERVNLSKIRKDAMKYDPKSGKIVPRKKYVAKEGVDPTKPPKAPIIKAGRKMEIEGRKRNLAKKDSKRLSTRKYATSEELRRVDKLKKYKVKKGY